MMSHDDSNIHFLRRLFDAAVQSADPIQILPGKLPHRPQGRVVVLGAGKASARMAEAVEAAWPRCDGMVITRYGYSRPCKSVNVVCAAHPVPDDMGLAATRQILSYAHKATKDDLVLALISGGASSLLCAPAGQITLAEKQQINAELLRAGAPIGDMNILRKHLSAVKGGQLAVAAYPAPMLTLAISDVPGDDLATIGSGPTVGDNTTAADALDIAERWGVNLPQTALQLLKGHSGVVATNHPKLALSQAQVIAAPINALQAAADLAAKHGFLVQIWGDAIEGEAKDIAGLHAARYKAAQKELPVGKKLIVLSGGELTVTHSGNGIGGPNAEYALALGVALGGQRGIYALSCDTDGVDGAADVAGAVISPNFKSKAQALNLNASNFLQNNDAHRFFAKMQDQVITGPTYTNVNDFRAALIEPI